MVSVRDTLRAIEGVAADSTVRVILRDTAGAYYHSGCYKMTRTIILSESIGGSLAVGFWENG